MRFIGRVATCARVMTCILLLAVSNTASIQAAEPKCGQDGKPPCHLTAGHMEFLQGQIDTLKGDVEKLQGSLRSAAPGDKSWLEGRIEALETQVRLLEQAKAAAQGRRVMTQPQAGNQHQEEISQPLPDLTRILNEYEGWHWSLGLKVESAFFTPSSEWAGLTAIELAARLVLANHMGFDGAVFLGVHPAQDERVQGEWISPFVLGGAISIGGYWDHWGAALRPQLTAISEAVKDEGMILLLTLPVAGEFRTGKFCVGLSIGPALLSEEARTSGIWMGMGINYCDHIPN